MLNSYTGISHNHHEIKTLKSPSGAGWGFVRSLVSSGLMNYARGAGQKGVNKKLTNSPQ